MIDPLGIQQLFPKTVVCTSLKICDQTMYLFPQEEIGVRHAVEQRRFEFATGRVCARMALKELGFDQTILPQKLDGTPLWPEQIVGSITHNHVWCAAAVAPSRVTRGIGIDLETIERMSPCVARKIITDEEASLIKNVSIRDKQTMLCLIFSAKESVYKCLYSVYGKHIGFQDIVIMPLHTGATFNIKIKKECMEHDVLLSGTYIIRDGIVATGIVFPPI
ncbi:MAG: 4'-phosphopantetheinyl transferase superfamily protein [Desulfobacterota bacterium]|nr:4'-phosphopantetheinyl transferase superfamily protein [Thermodesulfobacteriota bacterium]